MKIFISYSWDSEEHKTWVRKLADRLIESGIDVILDQYDLRGGEDMHKFMEKSVNDATHIIIICTPDYVERADERKRGAGEETSLITGEFYNRHESGKYYLPLLRESEEAKKNVPSYLSSLVYFDFTKNNSFNEEFEGLIRHIYDEPKLKKPALGKKPSFTDESHIISGDEKKLGISVNDIEERVLSSTSSDWLYDDDKGVYTNKHDIRLKIHQIRKENHEQFREEWTDRFPDPQAYRDIYEIYYDNNYTSEYFLVSVDGHRVSIPLPELGEGKLRINKDQYLFGKIINDCNNSTYSLDEYLLRAGIEIEHQV